MISLVALNDILVHHRDVKTTFLNGKLQEEIYIEQLEGFIVHGQDNKVCKLKKKQKTLYGIKQALKQWYKKIDNLIISEGFKVNGSDKCIYYKFENN